MSVRNIRRRRRFKLKYQAEPNLSRDSKQYVIAIFNNITSGVIIVINTVCNKHYIQIIGICLWFLSVFVILCLFVYIYV